MQAIKSKDTVACLSWNIVENAENIAKQYMPNIRHQVEENHTKHLIISQSLHVTNVQMHAVDLVLCPQNARRAEPTNTQPSACHLDGQNGDPGRTDVTEMPRRIPP